MSPERPTVPTLDESLVKQVPARVAHHYHFLPLERDNGIIRVLVKDPDDLELLDAIGRELESRIVGVVSPDAVITEGLRRYYGIGAETLAGIIDQTSEVQIRPASGRSAAADILQDAEGASIVKFVNQILLEAYRDRATDIHIEPFEGHLRVRYRIDGVLHEAAVPESVTQFQDAITSRIKIMSDLDIAERRKPQDGRFQVKVGEEELDVRVSVLPIAHGESVNMRLLHRSSVLLDLEELGLRTDGLEILNRSMAQPHGIILLTGPTGSGKTTTLYACLSRINDAERKILTIEDPVEYEVRGICQMQVHSKIDFDFKAGLRSMLRHDPDVMLVGEIRDRETAELAIRAALTGHLVFSTLHTNDAPGGVTRLVDLGVEPFLVASSLETVVAQRLVRRICDHCREPHPYPDSVRRELGIDLASWTKTRLTRGSGCERCRQSGYHSRTAIHEFLVISESMRELISQRVSTGRIRKMALDAGMRSLRRNGWDRIAEGSTTPDEVLRVTESQALVD